MKTIHDENYQKIIDSIISQRKNANMTQAQVAKKLDKPQSFIAKIEGKERRLDILEFIQICQILNTKPSALLQHLEL